MRTADSKATAAKAKSKRRSTVVQAAKQTKVAGKTTALALREKAKVEKVEQIDTELKRIAASINDREKSIRNTVKVLTQEVAETGKELLEAKKLHSAKGQKNKGFRRWVEDNCPFGVVSAYNYIRLHLTAARKPKLLLGKLQDAYIESGIKKALPHRPSHLKSANTADHDGPVIESNVVPVSDADYVSVPVPELDGWTITIQKDRVQHYQERGVAEIVKAVKQAVMDFFETAKQTVNEN